MGRGSFIDNASAGTAVAMVPMMKRALHFVGNGVDRACGTRIDGGLRTGRRIAELPDE
ncbi:MAG TPA: hypothetical protein VJ698_08730 [Noviherbaspirillum sp.]|uniref:hypothetical protein n=1 Tax=Noviherbaspirillum sp. TaxID=1926288 RepID=UPI002B47319B|nr:hypothetical protein [Noviherbaspirillum sp.]HJV85551.1 hypothetical protein [Noviherbaspirillum sp.]